MSIQQAFEVAIQHHQAGRLGEAEVLYRQILAVEPRHADALHLLGVIAHQMGRNDAAVDLISKAIALAPNVPGFYSNLGEAFRVAGQLDRAVAACRQAIALKPDYADAHYNLGVTLYENGRMDEAIAAYRRAIAHRPNYAEALRNLGVALYDKGEFDAAIGAYRQAIVLNPDNPGAYSNLGVALRDKGELDEAIAACRQAIALNPDFSDAHNNLGIALVAKCDVMGAMAEFKRAIELSPTNAVAHDGLGGTLLLTGCLQEGWRESEWRWKKKSFETRRLAERPRWDGSSLEGRTIRLQLEQGYGDVFQFCRYATLLAERGVKVLLESIPDIHALLETVPGVSSVVDAADVRMPFDVTCTLLTVPMLYGTTLETIPASTRYLSPDTSLVEAWGNRLRSDPNFKVGIVWAGRPTHSNDRNRSTRLETFAPLAEVPGVTFYSLQKGDASRQAGSPPPGMSLVDLSASLADFSQTAALIANLDLIIAVDTSVVHLAGAMGRPVWTLLPFAPDWRWLLDRTDSPWYPTMRLFRQPSIGDWGTGILAVREQLQSMVGSWREKL